MKAIIVMMILIILMESNLIFGICFASVIKIKKQKKEILGGKYYV